MALAALCCCTVLAPVAADEADATPTLSGDSLGKTLAEIGRAHV